jgi:hypothetical protein
MARSRGLGDVYKRQTFTLTLIWYRMKQPKVPKQPKPVLTNY